MHHQIKVVFSDLDGTLLNDNKDLPDNFSMMLDQLDRCGISFYTASGRTYITQKNLFGNLSGRINYICDNGAYIVKNGKMIFASILKTGAWRKIISLLGVHCPQAHPILCGIHGTYCTDYSDCEDLKHEIDKVYSGICITKNVGEISDDIFKISVCYPHKAELSLLPYLERCCGKILSAQLTDPSFVDIMNVGISKGSAVKMIQTMDQISVDETVVFGDFYNDIEMLQQATYSYIMRNAPSLMVKYGRFVAPDNNHSGVTCTVLDLVDLARLT